MIYESFFWDTESGMMLLRGSEINKIFVIVDFSASKTFTHHWKSIETFYTFLQKEDRKSQILVPKYAEAGMFEGIPNSNIKKVLRSPDFGPSKNQSVIQYNFNEIISKYFSAKSNKVSRIKDLLRIIFLRAYIRKPKKIILELCKSSEKVIVLFTSVEPVSVYLSEKLLQANVRNLDLRLRLIGSQSRGTLNRGNETERILNLSREFPQRLRIGFETFPYKELLLSKGFSRNQIYWSPFPTSEKLNPKINKTNRVTVGFLGSAKERKGFEDIPNIAEIFRSASFDFEFLVQQAIYPWVEYDETVTKMKNYSEINLLPGVISDIELDEFVAKCDLIILPYDAKSYALAASATLYHAAEFNIPVICTKGVGFGSEVSKFEIGFEFENLSDLNQIKKWLERFKEKKEVNFSNYNEARNASNIEFLIS
jgi:glycosyltransferase involved in cell wall biosynthesis